MALLKKSLAHRLLGLSRINNLAFTMIHQSTSNNRAPDPGDDRFFRRFLHRQSEASGIGLLFSGDKLLEKLRGMDIARDRIRLDGLRPPSSSHMLPEEKVMITVEDAKKIIKFSQLKSRLRQVKKDFVSYPEFLEICIKECSSFCQGMEFAKMLDESGGVIVLGNVVVIRPDQEN